MGGQGEMANRGHTVPGCNHGQFHNRVVSAVHDLGSGTDFLAGVEEIRGGKLAFGDPGRVMVLSRGLVELFCRPCVHRVEGVSASRSPPVRGPGRRAPGGVSQARWSTTWTLISSAPPRWHWHAPAPWNLFPTSGISHLADVASFPGGEPRECTVIRAPRQTGVPMDIALWTIASIPAVAFLTGAVSKVVRTPEQLAEAGIGLFEDFSPEKVKVIGALEVMGGWSGASRNAWGRIDP